MAAPTIEVGHGDEEYLMIDETYGIEILVKVDSYKDFLALKALINAATLADAGVGD